MQKTLDDELIQACPVLYRNGLRDGFRCEDGWFSLLRELSLSLEALCKAWPSGQEPPVALEVKEKFGELRFYLSNGDERTKALVIAARARSIEICERCGVPGEPTPNARGWIQTICSACAREAAEQAPRE